ncbi:uncharacterized protein H6S33_002212 [Morchella sextelata]|uniref:uncharacterized protein n=1 Tax=Morchella sextelata TaxID=1174677 RepID=UPI001D041644|nr:uncharacterized protein H6S33_002212 [Morchella sextelata]KAH0608160.1 hypothetical protein H6S33_002212 [Morchella sextelata]
MVVGIQALPIELIQQIATNLTAIDDLNNFSRTCRTFHSAIQPQFVYRELFLSTYDRPNNENYNYKHNYRWRKIVLEKFLRSNHYRVENLTQNQVKIKVVEDVPLTIEILEGVRELIFEATSKNFAQLESFASKSRNLLISSGLKAPRTQYFMLVQILLTNIALTKRIVWADTSEYCSAYTQALAYGEADRKLFANDYADEDDIIQIWATANLFLLHLGNRIPGSESLGLKLTFDGICGEGRGAPDLWKNNLWVDVEPEFPRYWFGFYVYLDPPDLQVLHTFRPNGEVRLQEDHYDGKLTMMEFLAKTPTTFVGTGTDADEPFTIQGSIKPLPTFYSIFKFRRVSFTTNYSAGDGWSYEGCLLPNSQTILGSWSTSDEDIADPMPPRGPFIMWAVGKEYWEYEKALRDDEGRVGEEDDFLNF